MLGQVIGNVEFDHHTGNPFPPPKKPHRHGPKTSDSQLQQRQVRVAVIGAVLALLRDIVLENRRRLGVVPVEAVEDGLDVLGPVGRGVEGDAHRCGGRWGGGIRGW